jgi:hypothetical protein
MHTHQLFLRNTSTLALTCTEKFLSPEEEAIDSFIEICEETCRSVLPPGHDAVIYKVDGKLEYYVTKEYFTK